MKGETVLSRSLILAFSQREKGPESAERPDDIFLGTSFHPALDRRAHVSQHFQPRVLLLIRIYHVPRRVG